jgi:hypothetical protein
VCSKQSRGARLYEPQQFSNFQNVLIIFVALPIRTLLRVADPRSGRVLHNAFKNRLTAAGTAVSSYFVNRNLNLRLSLNALLCGVAVGF